MATAISILKFFRTGAFGPLYLGSTRAYIEAALGPPDDYLTLSRRERRQYQEKDHWSYSRGWCYGDVELFFDEEHRLQAIHIDYLFERIPSGGDKIQLDPWILHPGFSLDEAESAFTEHQLAYHIRRKDPFHQDIIHLVLETGTDLYFDEALEDHPRGESGLRLLYFPDMLKTYYDEAGNLRQQKGRNDLSSHQ
ncbi:MAG: hypothetical protein J2P37_00745 [Ktedonobacteraceae bacterium]|nr:hypothetical protein [Ktedonobacteraceae bacterium]MBO0792517.1 hypothetical protein [Ktedonobacteraceae bacterium]